VATLVSFATADGTAAAPGDYTSTSGSVSIPANATTGTLTVPIVGDTLLENNETFVVNLSTATNGTITDNQAAGTITNDDAPPVVSVADASKGEGNSATSPMLFTVSLSGPSGVDASVSYATSNGTASAPGDYVTSSGSVTIPAGSLTATI